MTQLSFKHMQFTRDTLLGREGVTYSLECESDFDDASYTECVALWSRLFRTGLATSGDESSLLGTAAAFDSCPNGVQSQSALSAHSRFDAATATRRVRRLRYLDKVYLNSTLHDYEYHIRCNVSQRYLTENTTNAHPGRI